MAGPSARSAATRTSSATYLRGGRNGVAVPPAPVPAAVAAPPPSAPAVAPTLAPPVPVAVPPIPAVRWVSPALQAGVAAAPVAAAPDSMSARLSRSLSPVFRRTGQSRQSRRPPPRPQQPQQPQQQPQQQQQRRPCAGGCYYTSDGVC